MKQLFDASMFEAYIMYYPCFMQALSVSDPINPVHAAAVHNA